MIASSHGRPAANRVPPVLILFLLLLGFQAPNAAAETPPSFNFAWGTAGSDIGEFNEPWGIAVGPNGLIYVVDSSNDRIQYFDQDGMYQGSWGQAGSGDGEFDDAWGIAVDPSGNVYVVDNRNFRVQKFTASGSYLLQWGSQGSLPGQFLFPEYVAVDGAGNVYVTDNAPGSRVVKFTDGGTFITQWGSFGDTPGQFRRPEGIAVDPSGFIHVCDSLRRKILKFSTDGVFVSEWGVSGLGDGQIYSPISIAIDGSGNIFIGETRGRRVQKFDGDGSFLTRWGSVGSGDGQFDDVPGLATDGPRIFVSDPANSRIQRFGPYIPHTLGTPKLLLHVSSPVTKNGCAQGRIADCASAVVSATLSTPSGPFYFVYLLGSRGTTSGIAGIQCGISYEGNGPADQENGNAIDVFSWNLCGTIEFRTPAGNPPGANAWPGPGSGNLITWDYQTNCQSTGVAVGGYFYMAAYSADVFRLIPRPIDGEARIADCQNTISDLAYEDLGFASFSASGKTLGCNPCLLNCTLATPVQSATWGQIKTLFR